MKTKKILYLVIFIIGIFLFDSCKREPLVPVDFFHQQPLTNPVTVQPKDTAKAAPVYFNGNNAEKTDNGYHYKGTLYAKNKDSLNAYGANNSKGTYPVITGDFNINVGANNQVNSITGQGSVVFPKGFKNLGLGVIKQALYADAGYEQGYKIKQDNPDYSNLPFQDSTYYFYVGADNILAKYGTGSATFGKSVINFKSVFIDPLDPMVMFYGDFNFGTGKESFSISDVIFGISANATIPFTPLQYPDIENAVGDLGFKQFNANFYLAGTIPLDKFIKDLPVELRGTIAIRDKSQTQQEFLTTGIDAPFVLGANGRLFLTHDVLQYIPYDLRIELGRATVEYYHENTPHVVFAGQVKKQFASQNPITKMVGPFAEKYLDLSGTQIYVYARYFNPNDYTFYFRTVTGFRIPGWKKISGLDATFLFTQDSIGFITDIPISFGFGNIHFQGGINYRTGDFDLLGSTSTNIEILGVKLFASNFGLEISSKLKGVRAWGSIDLGHGIAKVDVSGEITSSGIDLQGTVSSNIQFKNVSLFAANLHAEISSNTGVTLGASLHLPYGIGDIEVSGKITKDELALKGSLSSHPEIHFAGIDLPSFNLVVSASTRTGVYLSSELKLPYGIGDVKVTGQLTSEKLVLTGSFVSKIQFGNFTLFNANLYARISTDLNEGVTVKGSVDLLGGLGKANVEGEINKNYIHLSGSLESNLDLGFTSFNSSINVNIDSRSGVISFDGKVDMPFGIKTIEVGGELHSNGHFKFWGSASIKIIFTKHAYAEAGISTIISNSSVSFSAYATLHVGKLHASVSVDIYVNWVNMTMTFKVHTFLGSFKVTVDKYGKDIKTGKQAVIRLDPIKN